MQRQYKTYAFFFLQCLQCAYRVWSLTSADSGERHKKRPQKEKRKHFIVIVEWTLFLYLTVL